ncbi:MAG: hypothetical protein ACOX9C_13150 [Kiritimatiellia bacterium]|jgi:hypothetical protein
MKTKTLRLTFLLFFVVAGCTTPTLHVGDVDKDIQLHLLPIENVAMPWPPALLVERYDGSGVSLNKDISAGGAEYVPGVAVLVVTNQGSRPRAIPNWNDPQWKIVIEREDGSQRKLALIDRGRYLPDFHSDVTLRSGQMAAVIVGLADYLPFDKHCLKNPSALCQMWVEYSGGSMLRSNKFVVQLR